MGLSTFLSSLSMLKSSTEQEVTTSSGDHPNKPVPSAIDSEW